MVKLQKDLSIKALQHQTEKIKFRSINKFPPANIGDTVRVAILYYMDRRGEDPRIILFACYRTTSYYKTHFDMCPNPLV